MMHKRPRAHEPDHLAFIRGLSCIICRDDTATEACHLRMADMRIGKTNPGVGQKPSDKWVLPMCGRHHRMQHEVGDESRFWASHGIDATLLCLALYSVSGDAQEAEYIMECARCR